MKPRRSLVVGAALVFMPAAWCDEAARVVARNAGKVDDAAKYQDEITRALATADNLAAANASSRIGATASSYAPTSETKQALEALLWDVACDVVTSNLPATPDEVADYLVARAAGFGLEFVGDAAQVVGDALLASLDSGDEASEAAAACQEIPDSGL